MKKNQSKALSRNTISSVKHNFYIQRQRLSCSSAYLEPVLAAFFRSQLLKHKTSSSKYISRLLLRFRMQLPKHLPKNVGPKRLHQDRVEGRERVCFTPNVEDYWDLKMMSLSADVSIGMVVAILIEMDMGVIENEMDIIYPNTAITYLKNRFPELFTIKLDLRTNHVQRSFHFRTHSTLRTPDF